MHYYTDITHGRANFNQSSALSGSSRERTRAARFIDRDANNCAISPLRKVEGHGEIYEIQTGPGPTQIFTKADVTVEKRDMVLDMVPTTLPTVHETAVDDAATRAVKTVQLADLEAATPLEIGHLQAFEGTS